MVTSSTVTLPTLRVENAPIYVEMVLPAHGWVRTPMAVSYRIHNHTSRLIDVDLSMEASDAFMFAGHKQVINIFCILYWVHINSHSNLKKFCSSFSYAYYLSQFVHWTTTCILFCLG